MPIDALSLSPVAAVENDWPATVYRYVEHYKFEPQHLLKGQSTAAFRSAIRRQEVPLNFLLNMLCVALPSPWIQRVLHSCDIAHSTEIPAGLVQRFPTEVSECQPDVRLETATERVFIESKVKAYSDTTQILKYLYLSAYLDHADCQKRPWLIYLTPGRFSKRWNPAEDRQGLDSGGMSALQSLVLAADLSVLGTGERAKSLIPIVDQLRSKIILGHGTWEGLGASLSACMDDPAPGEMVKPTYRMASDFLLDLRRRGHWSPGT